MHPNPGPPSPTPAAPPPIITITPWIDPLVDEHGHEPRSPYVERFWLPTLGPTATWLLRRLVAGFDDHPDGYRLDPSVLASSLGLSYRRGQNNAFTKAFGRCVMFGLAHQHSDGYAVRRRVPDLSRRHLARLPAEMREAHTRWLTVLATRRAPAAPETTAPAVATAVPSPPGVHALPGAAARPSTARTRRDESSNVSIRRT